MKRFAVAALIVVAGLLIWRGRGPEDDSRGRLAFDRVWIDHLPRDQQDPVQVFVVLTRQPLGVFQAASRWRGRFELFQYKRDDRGVTIHYPQTGEREHVVLRADRCGRGEFDYCLEIRGASRGARSYVSKKDWVVRSVDEANAKLDSLSP